MDEVVEPFVTVARPVAVTADVVIGGRDVVVMAGPCSVESYEPVSYTHLDVYKRQFLARPRGHARAHP